MIANKYSAIAVSLLSAGLLFTSTALAATLPTQASLRAINRPTQITGQAEIGRQNESSRAGIARENAQTKLADAKLKSCQARENSIIKRSTDLGKLTVGMQEKFDTIAARVKDYYATKVLPSGKTVTNYDSLVADIQTKKEAVQTALTKAQTDVAGFSCAGNDPKGQMTIFKEDMQAVKQELKNYRTSIKNLIVAVHSVTGTINSEKDSSESSNRGGNKP